MHELSTAFLHFAAAAEGVGATTKRLEKAAILARYFASLPDDALLYAARYFAGYAFPLRDQRTTNVGRSALMAAILAVTGTEEPYLQARLVALGDIGDVAGEAFAASPRTQETPPQRTLEQIAAALETLATTSGTRRKVELVTALLAQATPLEAKYLVKLLAGDLRIGLQEGAVEDALARWTGNEVGRVQWANMLTGDIGETAVLARQGALDSAQMRLFHPIKFMLATAAADLAEVARQMPPTFVVEDKFDGIRAQAHVAPALPGDMRLHGDVVVTAVEVGNGKRRHLLSDYTFAVRANETDNTLLNVGKAYSGLTDEELAALSDWFRAHTLQEFAHGKIRLVEPKIVLEVTFDRVQMSKRHKGGYALRFPRILRVRHDKPVQEIDTLDTVRRLAEAEQHEAEAEDSNN